MLVISDIEFSFSSVILINIVMPVDVRKPRSVHPERVETAVYSCHNTFAKPESSLKIHL